MSKHFAIIGDVHGNCEGLQAALAKIKKLKISDIVCLGDIVGYGADPERCWETVAQHCTICLKGNHEAMLCGECNDSDCSTIGKLSSVWTKENVSQSIVTQLSMLPHQAEYSDAAFYHTYPYSEDMWPYLNNLEQLVDVFADCQKPLVFYGHTHRPRITVINRSGNVVLDEMILETKEFQMDLRDLRCYINPGSVGQQRDTRTDVSFAICTIVDAIAKIKVYRIPYKRFRAYQKIKKIGCGKAVASYLVREKWRRDWFEFVDYWG